MNVEQFEAVLKTNTESQVHALLPSGVWVPKYFRVSAVGIVRTQLITTARKHSDTKVCMMQLFAGGDYVYRLYSAELLRLFVVAAFIPGDLPMEVEYQTSAVMQFCVDALEVWPQGLVIRLKHKPTTYGPGDGVCSWTESSGCTE
jgi:hypothetical protein